MDVADQPESQGFPLAYAAAKAARGSGTKLTRISHQDAEHNVEKCLSLSS